MFALRETGDWDIFLGPPERARAETGGSDQYVLKQRELPGVTIVNEKKRPDPWDTHYQFSINTLFSADRRGFKRGGGIHSTGMQSLGCHKRTLMVPTVTFYLKKTRHPLLESRINTQPTDVD